VARRDIVCIGASAGGLEALRTIAAGLPSSLQAAVFVVLHIPADKPSYLPQILSHSGGMEAVAPDDGEPVLYGRIYVAPPDRHLLLEDRRITLSHGPKENRARPAIDVLFRSAALTYGPRVIGIELTGRLDDGTAGLWAIKHFGGIAVVQSPEQAPFPSMPMHSIRQVEVDYVVLVNEIAGLIQTLIREQVSGEQEMERKERSRLGLEVGIAAERPGSIENMSSLGNPTLFACPECHGVLMQIEEGPIKRYRCHTGHAHSSEALRADMVQAAERAADEALRAFQELAVLLRGEAEDHRAAGRTESAERLLAAALEAEDRAGTLYELRSSWAAAAAGGGDSDEPGPAGGHVLQAPLP